MLSVETMRHRVLAEGSGFSLIEHLCSAGPADRPYEELHQRTMVAAVLQGSFRCRSRDEKAVLTPGALFCGNPGQAFECSHEQSTGDLCIAAMFEPDWVDQAVSALGVRKSDLGSVMRPVQRRSAAVVARASKLSAFRNGGTTAPDWSPGSSSEEFAHRLFTAAVQPEPSRRPRISGADLRRAHQAARHLEANAAQDVSLAELASLSGLSSFHFLRSFRAALGTTPHQYLLAVRLRRAAEALLDGAPVTEAAYHSGFADLSNFIRTFRAATGQPPGRWVQISRAS